MKLINFMEIYTNKLMKRYYYKNSTQYISQFSFGKKDPTVSDHARVECLMIHKKDKKKAEGASSTLEVIIQSAEFGQWLEVQ